MQVELLGFTTETRQVLLGLGQVETVNVTLRIAALQEALTVSAETNVIDLSSAKIGVNVSPYEVQQLPVNGRNFANLMTLATGATTDGNGGWASVRFNGKSNQQNYLNYDGVDGTYVWDASPGYLNATGSQFRLQTSMESVAEFRVNSGLAPAESGLGAGGNITVQVAEEGILLVDTGIASMSEKVWAAVQTLSRRPMRYIINTSAAPATPTSRSTANVERRYDRMIISEDTDSSGRSGSNKRGPSDLPPLVSTPA